MSYTIPKYMRNQSFWGTKVTPPGPPGIIGYPRDNFVPTAPVAQGTRYVAGFRALAGLGEVTVDPVTGRPYEKVGASRGGTGPVNTAPKGSDANPWVFKGMTRDHRGLGPGGFQSYYNEFKARWAKQLGSMVLKKTAQQVLDKLDNEGIPFVRFTDTATNKEWGIYYRKSDDTTIVKPVPEKKGLWGSIWAGVKWIGKAIIEGVKAVGTTIVDIIKGLSCKLSQSQLMTAAATAGLAVASSGVVPPETAAGVQALGAKLCAAGSGGYYDPNMAYAPQGPNWLLLGGIGAAAYFLFIR